MSGSNSGRTREGSILCTLSGSTWPRDSTSMWLQNSRGLNNVEERIIMSVPYLIKSSSRDRSRAFMGAFVYFHSRIRFLRPILPLQEIGYAEVGQKMETRAPMGNTPSRGRGQQRALFSPQNVASSRRPPGRTHYLSRRGITTAFMSYLRTKAPRSQPRPAITEPER